MMIARLDAWLGLRVFHPPIIWLCQRIGYTQYRLHREMWFAFTLWLLWKVGSKDAPWWLTVSIGVLAALNGLRAALIPDHVVGTIPFLWLRAFIWGAFLSSMIFAALGDMSLRDAIDDLWILVAEYAATISSIPPREDKRAARLKASEAKA